MRLVIRYPQLVDWIAYGIWAAIQIFAVTFAVWLLLCLLSMCFN